MCPNQEVERSLLPDCHIANRVFMYSMLDYLHSGERRSEDVHAELRDRYEVFCQVLHNFPMPLHPQHEGDTFDALQQQQQQLWQRPVYGGFDTSILMEINESSSSSNICEPCDFYENAMRRALAQLGGGMDMDMDMELELQLQLGDEEQLLNSSDDVN
ncbi:uncharacterized protein LOC117780815 [Drosophila innubila]|uniref:uncharacterized protein LOC117780815 n=1 Tax=Drosophila innubila TaxID=198719 RepID=UPI00148CE055|nr:uncharacterized protein LOC117780815 [Drosophila innubila]